MDTGGTGNARIARVPMGPCSPLVATINKPGNAEKRP